MASFACRSEWEGQKMHVSILVAATGQDGIVMVLWLCDSSKLHAVICSKPRKDPKVARSDSGHCTY